MSLLRDVDHVAIIGAGFSGTLAAINLQRFGGPRVTLIEDRSEAGCGLAFGSAHPTHLLNVRAARMSAFPDDPGHLVRWLEARGVPEPATAFIPRLLYGEYLRELLDSTLAQGDSVQLVHGKVSDASHDGNEAVLRLMDGAVLRADAAVLAIGNLPPHAPSGLELEGLPGDLCAGDPWASDVADGLTGSDTVLILGTGLTMVDVALMLDKRGFRGKIVAMSRRGLIPHVHGTQSPPAEPLTERPSGAVSGIVRQVRARADAIGWRDAVDELRPFTQGMWRAASLSEQARFLRHLRPWWDVHRHRIAPQVTEDLTRMEEEGRLKTFSGRPFKFTGYDGVRVDWQPRGSDTPQTLHVRRVINCTGPLGDLLRSTDPLLRALRERGDARPDVLHLGIDVDQQSRTINAVGRSNDWLYALGPMTRGAFWEIVAVPDIRTQVWALARKLANAHWVGGEGL